jgi:3-methyladenine DNA glycosylase AlkD
MPFCGKKSSKDLAFLHEKIMQLKLELDTHKDPKRAEGQSAYMRNKFQFLGISKPELTDLSKPFRAECKTLEPSLWRALMVLLWSMPERDYAYVALAMMMQRPGADDDDFKLARYAIETNSWWDTVDALASHVVGSLAKKSPLALQKMDQWIDDSDMWIRRTAIIFQLKYKRDTDWDRLQRYCLARAGEKEFFIQKAIGWALREYAKTAPKEVYDFVDLHNDKLAPLSFREACKHRLV